MPSNPNLETTLDFLTEMAKERYWPEIIEAHGIGDILLTLTAEIIAQRKEIEKLRQELNEKTDPRLFR